MPIRSGPPRSRRQIKADQHWDMAGLARQDGDVKDAERHTAEAMRLQRMSDEEYEAER